MLLKVKMVYNYYNKDDVSRMNTELAAEEGGAIDDRSYNWRYYTREKKTVAFNTRRGMLWNL